MPPAQRFAAATGPSAPVAIGVQQHDVRSTICPWGCASRRVPRRRTLLAGSVRRVASGTHAIKTDAQSLQFAQSPKPPSVPKVHPKGPLWSPWALTTSGGQRAISLVLCHSLATGLRGANPFSDACLIAMDYGQEKIIKKDWKSIFNDDQLDHVLKQILHLDHIHH
jgi:hypothetical protein